MTLERINSWQAIQARIRKNIINGSWLPGQLIPGEVDLAKEYGCSRTTVNRALRELAATGVIDRKRKAGTRVAKQRARQVRTEIPVIRAQVEAEQHKYTFKILEKKITRASAILCKRLKLGPSGRVLRLKSVHYADEDPFIYEERWINLQTIPEIEKIDLVVTSANEWLVQQVPLTQGDFVLEAQNANKRIAKALAIPLNTPILTSTRTTWLEDCSVTTVKLCYRPGFQMQFQI